MSHPINTGASASNSATASMVVESTVPVRAVESKTSFVSARAFAEANQPRAFSPVSRSPTSAFTAVKKPSPPTTNISLPQFGPPINQFPTNLIFPICLQTTNQTPLSTPSYFNPYLLFPQSSSSSLPMNLPSSSYLPPKTSSSSSLPILTRSQPAIGLTNASHHSSLPQMSSLPTNLTPIHTQAVPNSLAIPQTTPSSSQSSSSSSASSSRFNNIQFLEAIATYCHQKGITEEDTTKMMGAIENYTGNDAQSILTCYNTLVNYREAIPLEKLVGGLISIMTTEKFPYWHHFFGWFQSLLGFNSNLGRYVSSNVRES